MKETNISFSFDGENSQAHVTTYNPQGEVPIVALHGIGSSGASTFGVYMQHLSERIKVFAPDWIGFGESSRPTVHPHTYGANYCSQWYQTLIQEGIKQNFFPERFNVLAYSMSAIAIAKTYTTLEEHLENIIFINPAGLDAKINRKYFSYLSHPMAEKVGKLLARVASKKPLWWLLGKKTQYAWPEKERQRLIIDLNEGAPRLETLFRYAAQGFTPNGEMKQTHQVGEEFAKIKRPTLLLYSEHDEIFFEQKYLSFAREQGWQTECLEGEWHNVKGLKNVAQKVEQFLDAQVL